MHGLSTNLISGLDVSKGIHSTNSIMKNMVRRKKNLGHFLSFRDMYIHATEKKPNADFPRKIHFWLFQAIFDALLPQNPIAGVFP